MGAEELVALGPLSVVERAILVPIEEWGERRNAGAIGGRIANALRPSFRPGAAWPMQGPAVSKLLIGGRSFLGVETSVAIAIESLDHFGRPLRMGWPLRQGVVEPMPLLRRQRLLKSLEEIGLGHAPIARKLGLTLEDLTDHGAVGLFGLKLLVKVMLEELGFFVDRGKDPIAFGLDLGQGRTLGIGEVKNAGGPIEIKSCTERWLGAAGAAAPIGRTITGAITGTITGTVGEPSRSPRPGDAQHEADDDREIEEEREPQSERKDAVLHDELPARRREASSSSGSERASAVEPPSKRP